MSRFRRTTPKSLFREKSPRRLHGTFFCVFAIAKSEFSHHTNTKKIWKTAFPSPCERTIHPWRAVPRFFVSAELPSTVSCNWVLVETPDHWVRIRIHRAGNEVPSNPPSYWRAGAFGWGNRILYIQLYTWTEKQLRQRLLFSCNQRRKWYGGGTAYYRFKEPGGTWDPDEPPLCTHAVKCKRFYEVYCACLCSSFHTAVSQQPTQSEIAHFHFRCQLVVRKVPTPPSSRKHPRCFLTLRRSGKTSSQRKRSLKYSTHFSQFFKRI